MVGDAGQDATLKPGSVALLSWHGSWRDIAGGKLALEQIIHGKTLPKGFPYPDITGADLRKRPAYYYRQSSVIPYRQRHGQLEVLLVRSSRAHHWVVPKGIHEPGMSAQDSAAKEAEEEAGAIGVVDATPLGSYHYEKWGACCEVTVFPMAVTQLVPEAEWQESHRGRCWVTVDAATGLVKAQPLIPMLQLLVQSLDSGSGPE